MRYPDGRTPGSALHGADPLVGDAASPLMLSGAWLPDNPHQLDFAALPKLPSEHVVISDVRSPASDTSSVDKKAGGVNQHNYLAHHEGQFWAMWSDGPGVEDRVGQRVKFATSLDGLRWAEPKFLTPVPPNSGPDSPHFGTRTDKGISLDCGGFWQRDGELLARWRHSMKLQAFSEELGTPGVSLQQNSGYLGGRRSGFRQYHQQLSSAQTPYGPVDDVASHVRLQN